MTKISIEIDTDKPKDLEEAYNVLDSLNQVEEQIPEQVEQYQQHPTVQNQLPPQQIQQPVYIPPVQPQPIQPQPNRSMQPASITLPEQQNQVPEDDGTW